MSLLAVSDRCGGQSDYCRPRCTIWRSQQPRCPRKWGWGAPPRQQMARSVTFGPIIVVPGIECTADTDLGREEQAEGTALDPLRNSQSMQQSPEAPCAGAGVRRAVKARESYQKVRCLRLLGNIAFRNWGKHM